MTEKRFGIIKTKTYGLYVPVDKMKVYNFSGFESEHDCIRVVNALNDLEEKSRENGKIASKYLEENKQLKQELQKIYEIATVNKVRDIVENVYDDLLYETSDESDYARKKVLKCLEDIDNLRDDMND